MFEIQFSSLSAIHFKYVLIPAWFQYGTVLLFKEFIYSRDTQTEAET